METKTIISKKVERTTPYYSKSYSVNREQYLINQKSYRDARRCKCELCNKTVIDIKLHLKTKKHNRNANKAMSNLNDSMETFGTEIELPLSIDSDNSEESPID